MSYLCIGLFGTCGNSTWRQDKFIPKYEELGMVNDKDFFNPQIENWDPSCAEAEADHLANDAIILFPVLSETYALGSLAETGFSILQSLSFDDRRDFVILIENDVDEKLKEQNPATAKESIRARALVKEHLKKLRFSNVYIVDTLDEMLELSIKLYNIQKDLMQAKQKFNPHRKPSLREDEC